MGQILVRELAEDVIRELKASAQQNGRSLEAEVRMRLIASTRRDLERKDAFRRLDALGRSLRGRDLPDSTALIREDRDR